MRVPAHPADAHALYAQAALHLGRAFLLADQPDPAMDHLQGALDHGLPGGIEPHLPLLIAEAERCAAVGDHREAIQRWQDIAALQADATPEEIYVRLSSAYAANRSGFGGSKEENALWGDVSKHALLAWLHRWLQPTLYLEIGVDQGVSLACAQGPAIGVDPRPELKLTAELPPTARIVASSSDAFFKHQAQALLQPAPELAFIDGMHLFEFALRDLIHTEAHMAPWGLIVIDDIFLCHPVQAHRRRRSGSRTGDAWKLLPVLRQIRPDLTLLCLNAHTTGLLLIAGLDADGAATGNAALCATYPELVRRYRLITEPPLDVLDRHGAIPSNHPLVVELLELLRQAHLQQWATQQIQSALTPLQSRIAATEAELCGHARELSQQPCALPDPPDPAGA